MRALKRLLAIMFVVSALVAGAVALWGYARYTAFTDGPLDGLEPGGSLVVEPGDSFRRVLAKLREAGVRDGHELEWQVLARQLGAAGRIHVGEYALEPATTPRQLLERMRDGKVVSHRFTIVEGWNIRELRARARRRCGRRSRTRTTPR